MKIRMMGNNDDIMGGILQLGNVLKFSTWIDFVIYFCLSRSSRFFHNSFCFTVLKTFSFFGVILFSYLILPSHIYFSFSSFSYFSCSHIDSLFIDFILFFPSCSACSIFALITLIHVVPHALKYTTYYLTTLPIA